MAFILPRSPLSPRHSLAPGLDPACRIVRAGDAWALRDATRTLEEACARAQAIEAGANEALEQERRRGYEEGREQALMEQAEQMIENVTRNVDYFSKVEQRMVELVMEAVRKIVEGFDDHERVLITVRNILAVVRNQKQMTLRLHPQDVETVKARVNELLAEYPGVGYLDIVADSRLHEGACILESEIGMVEASMESQLQALQSAFERVLGSRV